MQCIGTIDLVKTLVIKQYEILLVVNSQIALQLM